MPSETPGNSRRPRNQANAAATPVRITLVHEVMVFADQLAAQIEAEGHEVVRIVGQGFIVPPPQASDTVEIAITQAAGRYPGLRIRLTGMPKGKPYCGASDEHLTGPVDVDRAMAAVRKFVG